MKALRFLAAFFFIFAFFIIFLQKAMAGIDNDAVAKG